jgi:hypothetical protein
VTPSVDGAEVDGGRDVEEDPAPEDARLERSLM